MTTDVRALWRNCCLKQRANTRDVPILQKVRITEGFERVGTVRFCERQPVDQQLFLVWAGLGKDMPRWRYNPAHTV